MVKIRAMVVFKGRTNLPEDQFVNTLYVDSGATAYAAACVALAGNGTNSLGLIPQIWNLNTPQSTEQLSKYMSRFLSRSAEVRFYNMADAKPRVPVIVPWTMNASLADTEDLPEEVACCVSFKGSAPMTARRRGRIYLGPLNAFAIRGDTGLDGGVSPSRPKLSFMNTAAGAFNDFRTGCELAGGMSWEIASQTPSLNYVKVMSGHVDDAWDTQRRRGVDPTSRVRFPAVP